MKIQSNSLNDSLKYDIVNFNFVPWSEFDQIQIALKVYFVLF